jgi:quercetin dioxygenase-like cupin family protein
LLQAPSASATPNNNKSRKPVDAMAAARDAGSRMVALTRLFVPLTSPGGGGLPTPDTHRDWHGIAAKFRLSYHEPARLCRGPKSASVRLAGPTVIVQELGGNDMDIYPCGSKPSRRGPADSFTGVVWQDPIIEAPAPARLRSGIVRFEPGARTHWHAHPLGQTLCVLSGIGRVQTFGGPVREIRAGDVVWIPPNEKHWHGASPTMLMVHVAMQEALDGKHVTWMEPVSDEQYKAAPG